MNILIVGLGSIAKKHIQALNSLAIDFNLYALRSSKNASIEEGIINIFDLKNTITFDFAIISSPTHLHYKFIQELAQINIPLFIEKPAVHSLENVSVLVDLINKKNLITYVACNLRFHPCLVYLKNKLEKQPQKINEINIYCGSYLPDWRPGKNFREIYSANASMGGGVHLDLFHELDYAIWLFGFPIKSNSLVKSNSTLKIDAIDYANYLLEYDTFVANIVLNYYRRKAKRQIEIVFENQTITIDLIKNTITDDEDVVLFEDKSFSVLTTYTSQLEYFINCLKENNSTMNSFENSIQTLKICLHNE
jgi:predicted dehydrogenase